MGFLGKVLICVVVLVVATGLVVRWIQHRVEQRKIKSAGDRGEDLFLEWVKPMLNSSDHLFRNVELDYEGSRSEIDTLIVNKNGIFIIEVKNYNGKLYGDADDFQWTKIKTSPGGNTYSKPVKNPIRQMKRQIYILSHCLRSRGIKMWISGYVYFINNNSPVNDDCVLHNQRELEQIIHSPTRDEYDAATVSSAIGCIKKLK